VEARARLEWRLLYVAMLLERDWALRVDVGAWFASVRHCWEMDHVVPVVEGGGGCGLEGLRTLCCIGVRGGPHRCHQRVTAELRRRLAARRVGRV
jgi:hypothetical protein